jgi:hypothetical protein
LVSTTFQTKVTPLQASIMSNNRSTTRSTTVLLLLVVGLLNVVCRVQTVTSHQQETVSKNDSIFNHANKQFFCADGGAPTDGRRRQRQTYGGAPINFCRGRRREKLGGAPASARRGPLCLSARKKSVSRRRPSCRSSQNDFRLHFLISTSGVSLAIPFGQVTS